MMTAFARQLLLPVAQTAGAIGNVRTAQRTTVTVICTKTNGSKSLIEDSKGFLGHEMMAMEFNDGD